MKPTPVPTPNAALGSRVPSAAGSASAPAASVALSAPQDGPPARARARVATGGSASLARREAPPAQPSAPGASKRARVDIGAAANAGGAPVVGHFNAQEQAALKNAEKVLVMEYSSTGGGHTARSLDPVLLAAREGAYKAGDCVVVLAPPRWESDRNGGKVNTLHDKADALRDLGLAVIVKQSDKTVTGLYQPNGDSDNVRMLRDFVDKPKRSAADTPLSTRRVDPAQPGVSRGDGVPAKALLNAVIAAVGTENQQKISVLGDMAPFLQKAAAAAGITKSVEIGNHQGLFIDAARTQLEGKDLAYLHKAAGSGHAQKLALVEYTDNVNVVRDLAPTMEALGITADTSRREARTKVLDHLLQFGNRVDTTPGAPAANGILVGPDVHKADDVKALVYLYVNDYTQGAAEHIRNRMAEHPDTHGKTMFALCGAGAVTARGQDVPPPNTTNILQLMYAANADGVTNAGFGTTSEFHYLAKNGYQGDFVAFPVVNQHEQEANAAQLVDAFEPGRVTKAIGAEEMYRGIDALVDKRAAQPQPDAHLGDGSMRSLFEASRSQSSAAGQAAALLASLDAADGQGVGGSANAQRASAAMEAYDGAESAKQHRRIYKLAVPALAAVAEGRETCEIRATSKVESTQMPVRDVAALLQGLGRPASLRSQAGAEQQVEALLGLPIDNASARALAAQLGQQLGRILSEDGRAAAADQALRTLANERVALGW